MQWSDIPRDPTPRLLRQFAGLWLIFFGAAAYWQGLVRERVVLAAVLGILAVAVGSLGLTRPGAVRPVFVGWMILAFPVGWLVSYVLTAGLFFVVFTPVGLFFRLTRRDPLGLRRGEGRSTFWSDHPKTTDPRRYLREF